MPKAEKEVLSEQYQQKTDKEHILDNPDTYIGSIENIDSQLWVFDEDSKNIKLKPIEYIPGLYKLFDEGIVNSRDHVVRMINSPILNKHFVSQIKVNINEDGLIEIMNDGNGIDIAKHPEYKIWIPEMIFGHLRTSTNYDENKKNLTSTSISQSRCAHRWRTNRSASAAPGSSRCGHRTPAIANEISAPSCGTDSFNRWPLNT